MKIWAHTLVKNEERFIWYALMSVIEHVDKILVWDTGSTDNTVAIVKQIIKNHPDKIVFREVGAVTIDKFTEVRQEMLLATNADWMMILDGDEVWWEDSIIKHIELIKAKGSYLESLVTPYKNIIGDMFHYLSECAGKYTIDGRTGNLTIRFNNMSIPGLTFKKPHGQQGLYDNDGNVIQNRSKDKRIFIDAPYLHFTHMPRSVSREEDVKVPKRGFKYKYEIGNTFPLDFYYPEVFFRPRPSIVPNIWTLRSKRYEFAAYMERPLKFIKRKVWLYGKSGY